MKKLLTFIILTALTAAVFSSCQKEEEIEKKTTTTYQAYFTWAKYKPMDSYLALYLDGKAMGLLPFRQGKLMTCANDTLKKNALHLTLNPGTYQVEVREQGGPVQAAATLKITESSLSNSGTTGKVTAVQQDDCLLVEFDN